MIPDAIRELLEQRSRYHGWLAKLASLGGKYSPDVAERVRADYQGRLREVEQELHEHRAELENTLDDHVTRLEDVVRRHAERSAQLEEAELRFQVGEFEQAAWDELRDDHRRHIAALETERSQEQSAVSELERVLAEVTGQPARAAAVQVEPGAWPAPAGMPAGKAPPPVSAPAAEAIEVQTEVVEVLEVAEESAATAPAGHEAAARPPDGESPAAEATPDWDAEEGEAAGPPAASEVPASEGDEFLDELEFLESLSLDDPDSFDAVSRMLEEEGDEGPEQGGAR